MKPELIALSPTPELEQKMVRMMRDVITLEALRAPEIRGIHDELKAMRDRLSQLLEKTDAKHV